MKTGYFIGISVMSLLLAGCKQEKPTPPSPSTPPTPTVSVQTQAGEPGSTVTSDQVKQAFKNAATVTQTYVWESKDEAVAAMQKELQEMDAKLDQLKDKSKPYADEAKTNADSALATLQVKRDEAAVKLDELKAASADKWKDVKSGFDSAMDDLKEKYRQLKDKFSN